MPQESIWDMRREMLQTDIIRIGAKSMWSRSSTILSRQYEGNMK